MRQLFLTCILQIIITGAALATQIDIHLLPNEHTLIKITNSELQLEYSYVDTNEPSKVYAFSSPQRHIQTELILFGPVTNTSQYELTIPYSAKVEAPLKLSLNVLNNFKYYSGLLDQETFDANAMSTQNLHQILTDHTDIDLPYALKQNLTTNLAYLYSKSNEIDKLLALLSNGSISIDHRILLQCNILQHKLEERQEIDRQIILLVADNAKNFVLRNKQLGKLTKESRSGSLNKSAFVDACSDTTYLLEQRGMAVDIHIEDSEWSLITASKSRFDFALFESTKLSEALTTSKVLNRYWFYYNSLPNGNAEAGITAYQALNLMQEYPDEFDEISELLVKQYSIFIRQGQYAKGRKTLSSALAMIDDVSPHQAAIVLFTAGHFYRKLGELDIANRFFIRSIETYKKTNPQANTLGCSLNYRNFTIVGTTLTLLSFIERQLGNLELASQYADCAIEFLEDKQESYLLNALLEKARLLQKENEFNVAKSLIERVLKSQPYPAQSIDAHILLLDIALQEHQLEESKKQVTYLGRHLGLVSFTKLTSPNGVNNDYPIKKIDAYTLMIKMCTIERKKNCVEMFFNAADKLIKSTTSMLSNPQAWNAARYKLVEQYVDSILTLTDNPQKQAVQISNTLEQHYSLKVERNLFQFVQYDDDTKQTQFKNWMATERAVMKGGVSEFNKNREMADVAKSHYFGNISALTAADTKSPKNVLTTDQIQSRIQPNQLFIRYFISDTHSFAIELTNELMRIRQLPSKQEIADAAQIFMSLTGKIDWKAFKRNALLTQLLPIDLITNNSIHTVIVIPDYILHRLPFSAVNISSSSDTYLPLVAKSTIVRTDSASTYFSGKAYEDLSKPTINESPANTRSKIAIFSAHSIGSVIQDTRGQKKETIRSAIHTLPPLLGAQKEADFLIQLFGKRRVINGIGPKATSDFLMSTKTRKANILHVATHGVFDPDLPDIIGLMTSTKSSKSFITLSELMSKPFYSELVVVSGCDTMLGKYYKGSGMRSITRGFLVQGAGAVIGTLWSVPDRSTSEFMQLFYTNLNSGSGNIANALNQTKTTFSLSARYKKPKYWAGFVFTSSNQKFNQVDILH